MAINWPPATAPQWPPAEIQALDLSFSDISAGIIALLSLGFTRDNPTAQENNAYFKGVRCDEGHPCNGIMIVSPTGIRYPFAYCTGATHKSALVLWPMGIDAQGQPAYDLGWGSGAIT